MPVAFRHVPDVVVAPAIADVADGSGARTPAVPGTGRVQTTEYTRSAARSLGTSESLAAAASIVIQVYSGVGTAVAGSAAFEFQGDFRLERSSVVSADTYTTIGRFKGTAAAPATPVLPNMATAAADGSGDITARFRVTNMGAAAATFWYVVAGDQGA